jgi:hypothetical protein
VRAARAFRRNNQSRTERIINFAFFDAAFGLVVASASRR